MSNAIYLTIAEGYQNCGYKTIRTFELTKDLDYDYIFRTNSSSYIDKEFLSEYLRNKPRNKYYSGIIGDHNGIKYAPGSGYVLSRDLVNIVLENVAQWDHSYIDDVSLGLVLKSKGHTPTPGPRFDNHTKNIFQLFFNKIPLNYFHYRLKSKNRSFDIVQMKKIFLLKKIISIQYVLTFINI